jgi:pimeloyl-ACP methyl ester carboxylesterase
VPRTEHSFVAPSGLSLAVHDWGGTGDPVLLSHPTGFHGVAWQPVAERLVARGRRVWSFDFRGHGDSDPAPGGYYHWSGFADDARAVADHLGLSGDPTLLAAGHSKGGASVLLGAIAASRDGHTARRRRADTDIGLSGSWRDASYRGNTIGSNAQMRGIASGRRHATVISEVAPFE